MNNQNFNNNNNNPKDKKKDAKIGILFGMIFGILSGIMIYAVISSGILTDKTEEEPKTVYDSYDDCTDNLRLEPGMGTSYKPIIYLYPEKEMKVSVKLGSPEKLTCTYPKYDKDGWNVIAQPDGKLIDTETDRNLYALYWEGLQTEKMDLSEGFVVKGSNTIKFLENKLKTLGLNEYEAEEFIVYWLPKLEANEYNFIRFATKEEIDKNMPLEISGNPDSIIRVLMQYKPLDEPIKVKEQKLTTPERTGFTVVEWGGTEIK